MSYDPTIGRWTQEDPIAFEGGDANLYRYVGNDPVNATDPTGLQTTTINGVRGPAHNWAVPPPPPPWTGPYTANPTAQPDFDELRRFLERFPYGDVPWIDPCFNWASGIVGSIPNKFLDGSCPIKVRRVCFDVSFYPLASAHTAFEVTFPDGSVVYFDEGSYYSEIAGALGGPDRFFGPDGIPWNYTLTPCELQIR
jgi:hypothetical protein